MVSSPSLSDYLSIFRRRKLLMMLPFVLLFGASVAIATLLPAEYESKATIRIDRQQIPSSLLESTVVVGYVNEQLSDLAQSVMSTESLWALAEEHDLYPELRDSESKSAVAEEIRRHARREILYVDVGEEEQQRNVNVAVAFTVTYASQQPEVAKTMANALARRYIEESDRSRTEQAQRLTRFLRERTAELEERIAEREDALAAFKEKNASALPEFVQFNMTRLENIQDQIDQISESINAMNQLRIGLEAQLTQVEPRRNVMEGEANQLTPDNQVERLRLDYLSMSGSYAPRHPSFARLRNQLQSLVGEAEGARTVLGLIEAAEEDRGRLFALRAEGVESGSEVEELERSVANHREQLRLLGRRGGENAAPDNPAYIAVSSRLESVESEIAAEMARREALRARVNEFDLRVVSSPSVEREYRVLQRGHEQALEEHAETRDKLLKAEAAERLESGQIGDRFTLASGGSLPLEPVRPLRLGIAMLGFVFAAGTSTGVAAIAEYFDRTLRGVRGVMAIWGAPPLATIPVVRTRIERRRGLYRLVLLVLLLVVIAAVAAGWLLVGEDLFAWTETIS